MSQHCTVTSASCGEICSTEVKCKTKGVLVWWHKGCFEDRNSVMMHCATIHPLENPWNNGNPMFCGGKDAQWICVLCMNGLASHMSDMQINDDSKTQWHVTICVSKLLESHHQLHCQWNKTGSNSLPMLNFLHKLRLSEQLLKLIWSALKHWHPLLFHWWQFKRWLLLLQPLEWQHDARILTTSDNSLQSLCFTNDFRRVEVERVDSSLFTFQSNWQENNLI